MKRKTFRAYLTASLPDEPPASIEWMPAGYHEIEASSGGKPALLKVTVSEADVGRLNDQLQVALARAASGLRSRPYIDFNHEGKEAAAIPVRFVWEDGIRLEVEWTQAGKDAVLGRVYSYFSPEFFMSKDGHPAAIPEYGPIGALVNTPAFQSIERLAAAHTQELSDMNNITKLLGIAEDSTQEQIEAAISSLTAKAGELSGVQASLVTVTAERDALTVEIKASKAAAIAAEVETHVSAKRITAESKDFWTASFERDAEGARKALAAIVIPKATNGVDPIEAEHVNTDPDQLKGEALLAHYKSLTGDVRAAFYAKHENEIWAAHSAA